MAKRRQTTGMPSRKRSEQADVPQDTTWLDNLLGNPRNRAEREDAINRLIIRSLIAIGVIIAVVIGIALIWDQIIVPNRTVATVNGETVTVREFRDRVNFERARLTQELNSVVQQAQNVGFDPNQLLQQEPYRTWLNEVNFPDALGQRVLNDIVDDILIRQQAEELGVSVSEDDVQSEINEFFGYDPTEVALIGTDPTETPTPTVTPTPFVSPTPSPVPTNTPQPSPTAEVTADPEATEEPTAFPTLEPTATLEAEERREQAVENFEQSQQAFRDNLRAVGGVNEAMIEDYFERLALRQAVQEELYGDVNTALYVNARHILVDTEARAQEIIDALNAGEPFSELARAYSTDEGSAVNGGNLDWSPISNYVPEFGEVAASLPIGEISEPVQSEFGYHIIQVIGREEREVTGQQLQSTRNRLFDTWLEELRAEQEEDISISDDWTSYVPS